MMRRSAAPSVFALALLLCVASVIADDDQLVSCGSAIKIRHADTGYFLNSEEKQMGGGSGQQIITFVDDANTHNTLWNLRPAHHDVEGQEYPVSIASCQLAEPVKCGGLVRLTHASTKRNLHSHRVESVLSRQQEVTGYGTGDAKGDNGDNWTVECVGSAKFWKQGASVRLKHRDTGAYLGTSKNVEFNQNTCGHACPIMGHLEAFGRASPDAHTLMTVDEGIHLSK